MKTSKLLVLGLALLLWIFAPAAGADEALQDASPEASAAAEEIPAELAEEIPAELAGDVGEAAPMPLEDPIGQGDAAAEPMADELAAAPEDLKPMGGEAESFEVDPEAGLAAQGLDPENLSGLETVVPAPEPAPGPTPQLGMVGWDSQGREGRIHVVVSGDTLWDVSDAYLGTPWVWPSIWQDNQAIENPHLIFPGDHIWITPWEMRKLTPDEVADLLAGPPAAPEPEIDAEPIVVPTEPESEVVAPVAVVQEERPTVLVSNREKVGLVTSEEVEASASIVSSVVKRVMLSQNDDVWIGLGEDDVEVGDEFTIYRIQEKVYDPETNRMLGYHVHMLGWLEVTEVNAETALARIRESTLDIAVTDRIMPRQVEPAEVAVLPSPGDIRGQISFLAQQRTLMGTLEYVFLNRGTLDGLEVGSPLEVYRDGFMANETTRGERVEIPDRVVADLLVVKAEPEVSVALIRHTAEELALGDLFRGVNPIE
ncbi:MAG: LysM domain-containing protein [Myxococcota bacterium]|nr:LysM domain-containing protein [Myxococcota bacterium]